MGVCDSSLNSATVKHSSDHLFYVDRQSNIENSQLVQAKQVIDALNLDVDSLENELQQLKAQVSKERLLRNEEQSKLRAAQIKIEKIESEKDELSVRLSEISVVNAQPIMPETSERLSIVSIGRYQSPINIISTTHCGHTKVMNEEALVENPLTFYYSQSVSNCTLSNDGQSVRIKIDASNKCSLCINDKQYSLKQIDFRTPSEHTIDSKQHEMEMQMVHISEQNEIAVLAFLFSTKQRYQRSNVAELTQQNIDAIADKEESDDMETDDEMEEQQEENKQKGNEFLEQFFDELPLEKTSQDVVLPNGICFDYLFETSSSNFVKNAKSNEMSIDMEMYEYVGSLTTHPFTEGVQWMVAKSAHFIHPKQLEKLPKLNDSRPVQDYFGRMVSIRSKSSMRAI